jgi:putative ABC transport system substrate-binding protein
MNATKTIPIVHPNAIDPLNSGLIDSLAHPGRNLTGGAQLTSELSGSARGLGVTLQSHEVQGPKDFAVALAAIAEERPDALLVLQDALANQHRKEIVDFAIQKRLPSMFKEKEWAMAGGLMSYGENFAAMYRRAAYFVDQIFKGAKPADLPVEQAAKFDLVLNLRTAKAIGLTIPDTIHVLADQFIE